MTNYGLPLRFKAVEIATGEKVPTSKLMLDPSDGQWYACYGGDTIRFDEEWVTEVQLYQSTGHHDTNSKEIFFGDVAINSKGDLAKVVMKDQGEMAFDSIFNPGFEFYEPLLYSAEWTVLGNIHHSREELERRAKEVRGDV